MCERDKFKNNLIFMLILVIIYEQKNHEKISFPKNFS